MRIPYAFRPAVRASIWTLAVIGVVTAFITLPVWLSVTFASFTLAAGWFADRAVYRLRFGLFHAGMELLTKQNERLGFLWGWGIYRGHKLPQIAILFDTRKKAALAYATLRTWAFRKYVDRHRDIMVSVVWEGGPRYTAFLYPGKRAALKEQLLRQLRSNLGGDTTPEKGFELVPFLSNSADYSDRPEMLTLMQELRTARTVLVNTAYVRDNRPVAYARRSFHTSIEVLDRATLSPTRLEHHVAWRNPKDLPEELIQRCRSIDLEA